MKMSGMLTRSSMACSFRPSRCRSKASPRMACRRGRGQGQGPQGATALPRSLWQQHLFHPVAPGTCETRASGQESPHFADGETEPRDLPGEAGRCRI